jgi:hypothetical protein
MTGEESPQATYGRLKIYSPNLTKIAWSKGLEKETSLKMLYKERFRT